MAVRDVVTPSWGPFNRIANGLLGIGKQIRADRELQFFSFILLLFLLTALVGPSVAPYDKDEILYSEDGELLRSEPPSLQHPMGTTASAQDVLSRFLIGARPTMLTGLLGGIILITIGTTVGVTAGYVGGVTENVLMRITDVFYSLPVLAAAIVLLGLFEIGQLGTIAIIGLLLWRGSARILRSQVLQIKERPFVLAAKATGMSTPQIIWKHILPNIAPMIVLFFSLGIGAAILIQAGLAFIGISDPFVPSWGVMIRNVYSAGMVGRAPWWAMAPGLGISLTVLSTFMFGRKYEELVSGDVDGAGAGGVGA